MSKALSSTDLRFLRTLRDHYLDHEGWAPCTTIPPSGRIPDFVARGYCQLRPAPHGEHAAMGLSETALTEAGREALAAAEWGRRARAVGCILVVAATLALASVGFKGLFQSGVACDFPSSSLAQPHDLRSIGRMEPATERASSAPASTATAC